MTLEFGFQLEAGQLAEKCKGQARVRQCDEGVPDGADGKCPADNDGIGDDKKRQE